MGYEGSYGMTNIGIVTFQRDSSPPLTLKYGMYVPSLKKNLVSVAMLEDHGYDVTFSKGKVLLLTKPWHR